MDLNREPRSKFIHITHLAYVRRGRDVASNNEVTDDTRGSDDAVIRVLTVIATICKVDIECYGGTDGARTARTGGRGLSW